MHRLARPRMPGVSHLNVARNGGIVGVLSLTYTTTNTAIAVSAMSPRHSVMPGRIAPCSLPATRSTRRHGNATRNAGVGRPAIGHRLAPSPSIRSATASSGRQLHKSCFPVRAANLLSRPDLAAPRPRSATKEMGGAEPPAARPVAREHGEAGEHRTFSAVSAMARSSPVGGSHLPNSTPQVQRLRG